MVAVMMEALSNSETSVHFYETARRNIPQDSHIYTHRVNLKCLIASVFQMFLSLQVLPPHLFVHVSSFACPWHYLVWLWFRSCTFNDEPYKFGKTWIKCLQFVILLLSYWNSILILLVGVSFYRTNT
jgi:hypothetical protein